MQVTDRIAIIGGDRRSERLPWPEGYDIALYQSTYHGGQRELDNLTRAWKAGRLAFVIVYTKFIGHDVQSALRRIGATIVLYSGSLRSLTQDLPEIALRHGIRAKEKIMNESPPLKTSIMELLKSTESDIVFDVSRTQPNVSSADVPATDASPKDTITGTGPQTRFQVPKWTEEEIMAVKTAIEQDREPNAVIAAFRALCPNSSRTDDAVKKRLQLLSPSKTVNPTALILKFLTDNPGKYTFAQIGRKLSIDKKNVSGLLTHMFRRGYVQRSGKPFQYKIATKETKAHQDLPTTITAALDHEMTAKQITRVTGIKGDPLYRTLRAMQEAGDVIISGGIKGNKFNPARYNRKDAPERKEAQKPKPKLKREATLTPPTNRAYCLMSKRPDDDQIDFAGFDKLSDALDAASTVESYEGIVLAIWQRVNVKRQKVTRFVVTE